MRVKTLALGALTLVAAALIQPALAAEEVTLKVAHFLSPNAPAHQKVILPWCERLTQESAGKIKCQIYPAMQLGGTPSQLVDQVRNGVADVVWTAPGYSTGRFPAIETLELPFMVSSALDGSRAAWEFYQTRAAGDFEAYKVLAVHIDGGAQFSTAKTEIKTLADLKGLKIRVPTRLAAKEVIAFGGAPVSMPAGQVTEAISKGVVDGALAPWEVLHQTKLDEVTKFHIDPPAGKPMYVATVLAVLMNKDTYARMSPELKAIIDRNSGLPLVENFGKAWEEARDEARKAAETRGNKLATLTPADYDAMVKAAEVVETDWIKDVAAKGLDGKALAGAARSISAKYSSAK